MQVEKTHIDGLLILNPTVFNDERGYFFESYNRKKIENFLDVEFVQDNESQSQKGVLRGLHFQKPPHAQGKLVRVIKGKVLDVAVDLRANSNTYGQHYSIILSEKNKKQFYIPKGFAHGFLVLENNTIFSYKCTNYYNKASEASLLWCDKDLNIDWQIKDPIISEKDMDGLSFTNFKSPF